MWLTEAVTYVAALSFLLTHPVWDVTASFLTIWALKTFLLTHPVWDVTGYARYLCHMDNHFYSHIPCGMWRIRLILKPVRRLFLLTHPVWDVTIGIMSYTVVATEFLLTHPVWDVTLMELQKLLMLVISTHTSRVGCDSLLPIISVRFSISTHTSRVGCDRYI